ncbi:MAG: hypothetical protein ABFR75_00945 [Acidobacteriota bacterium]
MEGKIPEIKEKQYKCKSCGGILEYDPEASSLKCPFCGKINKIKKGKGKIEEEGYLEYLKKAEKEEVYEEKRSVKCDSCGSEFGIRPEIISTECPFCATPIVFSGKSKKTIRPKAVQPFKISEREAKDFFKKWVKSRWFAPSELKELAFIDEKITGIYLPYWTFDANTVSYYTGDRGDNYTTNQSYSAFENGKNVTKTRSVTHTKWTSASGVIFNPFDDVLVPASRTLPEKFTNGLEPWNLKSMVPYKEEYLSGFTAESYQLEVDEGFVLAKKKMSSIIWDLVRKDIGGDKQKVYEVKTNYDKIKFKHVLLPLWISSYRFDNKVFRFVINAVTGEIRGERPWSWIKILLFIMSVIAIIALLVIIL